MRAVLVVALMASGALAAVESQVVDRVVRYVNDDIITAADQWERVRARARLMERNGEDLPRNDQELEVFAAEALEELTDEQLLLQEADRMGVEIDARPIRRKIRLEAGRFGDNLAAQKQMLEGLLRRERIRQIEGYFAQYADAISPAELAAAYEERRESFRRPARLHPARILLRPSTERERERVFRLLLEVFRESQADPDPAVQAVVTAKQRAAYVETRDDPAAQLELLAEVADAVLEAAPADPERKTAALLEGARRGLQELSELRSEADCDELLTAVREELLAIEEPAARAEAFAAAARRVSQGPRAGDGGDLGWVEAGELDPGYDAAVSGLAAGELSPVVGVDGARVLMLMAEREEARQRSLGDVSAELRSILTREREAAARKRLLAKLRDRALIRDLAALEVEDVRAATDVKANADDLQSQVDARVEAAGDALDAELDEWASDR